MENFRDKDHAPVVQALNSAIQRITISETNCVSHWIDFYLVDSAIQRLNNRGQASVVQRLDSAIHRINLYPVDSAISSPNTYPLDSDLPSG